LGGRPGPAGGAPGAWDGCDCRTFRSSTPSRNAAVDALSAASGAKVVVEGCYGPRDGGPGRAYLAVADALWASDGLAP